MGDNLKKMISWFIVQILVMFVCCDLLGIIIYKTLFGVSGDSFLYLDIMYSKGILFKSVALNSKPWYLIATDIENTYLFLI